MNAPAAPGVSVVELQRAWGAARSGAFRSGTAGLGPQTLWIPTERVIVVRGLTRGVGATVVSLALAECAARAARVIEMRDRQASGLSRASNAEMGQAASGWSRSQRGLVVLERPSSAHPSAPDHADVELTIVDAGAESSNIDLFPQWGVTLAVDTVYVSTASVPGVEALERSMERDESSRQAWAVVVGPAYRRWPRAVKAAVGPRVRAALDSSSLVTVPRDRELEVLGLGPRPLPDRVLRPCAALLRTIESVGAAA